MLRSLYDWTLSLAAHPRALWALAIVAFVESSFFPIPPDVLMIPMIIAAPRRSPKPTRYAVTAPTTAAPAVHRDSGSRVRASTHTANRPVLRPARARCRAMTGASAFPAR